MVTKLVDISKQELIRKVLAGEKDFRYVRLPADTNFMELDKHRDSEEVRELKTYCRVNARAGVFKSNPINISGSGFRGVKMMGLELPFLQAEDADFSGAWLYGVELYKANFQRADFEHVQCPETCFENADFSGANVRQSRLTDGWTDRVIFRNADIAGIYLDSAYLRGVDFEGAEMANANLEDAILFGALNLDKTRNLERARLNRAKVILREKEMIEQCYRQPLSLKVAHESTLATLAFLERIEPHHPHHKSYEGC